MKTIVFAPAVFNLGETTRMIEIAKKLSSTYENRYECIFIGFSDTFSSYIEESGFKYILLEPIFSKKDEELLFKFDQGKTLRNPFSYWRVSRRVAKELEVFKCLKPELVVTGTNLTVFLSARISGIPLIYVKPFPTTRAYLSLKNCYVPYKLKKFKFIWYIIKKILLSLSWKPYSFQKTARDYNLSIPKYTIDLLDGDWNFITTHPIFVNNTNFPNNFIQAGPIVFLTKNRLSKDILKFIERARTRNKRIIYFSMGSSSNSKIVKKVLNTLKDTDFFVIAAVERYLGKDDFLNYPESIFITNYIPTYLLNKYITFSIIHGGEGSVQTACSSGRPFIGIPLQYEQEVNVHNCVDYGNAIMLSPNELTKKNIEKSIGQIQTTTFMKKAEEIKCIFSFDGSKIVAEWIDNYCN